MVAASAAALVVLPAGVALAQGAPSGGTALRNVHCRAGNQGS